MKFTKTFVCDFETTVYEGQRVTEVWASAFSELGTEKVYIDNCIGDTYRHFAAIKGNVCAYYHNLKFDGNFWVAYLIGDLGFTLAFDEAGNFKTNDDMKNYEVKTLISDMGQWYTITFKVNNKIIELRDSLKLLPFSVDELGRAYNTKHRKKEMEYKGRRFAGCEITEEEKEYIRNDVLVVNEVLTIMFKEGHKKLTIGSCCISEYKSIFKSQGLNFENFFPDLTQIETPFNKMNCDEVIRKAYKGGWCYVADEKKEKILGGGCTADVNSLYPSMMHSDSGNYFPVGEPEYWEGDYIPKFYNKYYFVIVKTDFEIKQGFLPFIQIKGSKFYSGNENLKSSRIKDRKTGEYYNAVVDKYGNTIDTTPTLVLTCTDWELFKKHYNLYNTRIIGGVYFNQTMGIFDEYINKYSKIKQENKGAKRTIAKLFLNSCYGKFATSSNSSFKYPVLGSDGVIHYKVKIENNKKVLYIPIGAAITSYARRFTITAAQKNYHGAEKGFCYADTDSIHCDFDREQLQGVPEHPTKFNHWKIENEWDSAIFLRQKTYIEHTIKADGENVKPYYLIKCAGMPEKCKMIYQLSMKKFKEYNWDERKFYFKLSDTERKDCLKHRTMNDFKAGFKISGKLLPHVIRGGVVLKDVDFTIKD